MRDCDVFVNSRTGEQVRVVSEGSSAWSRVPVGACPERGAVVHREHGAAFGYPPCCVEAYARDHIEDALACPAAKRGVVSGPPRADGSVPVWVPCEVHRGVARAH